MTVTPWSRLPPELADRLAADLSATVAAVAAAARDTPRFAAIADPKFAQDVDTAVQVGLERFVELIATSQPALPPTVREVYVGLGAAEARDDRGPDVLVVALRAAARTLFRLGADALADIGCATTDGLVDLSDAIQAFVDELAGAATDGFALQVREQAGEGDRLRRHLAELLLRGTASAEVLQSAAAAIGWSSPGAIVPVLLPSEHARHVRFRYSADGLVVERENDVVLLVREGARASRAALTDALSGREAVVGVLQGKVSLPENLRLAEQVRSSPPLRTPSSSAEPVFVDDLLAELALFGHPEALSVLAAARLAPFDALPESQRERLLDTLSSWLRHWGSRADIAAELFVHPQTVSYRIRRLRQLLGDDLDDPRTRFELQLALATRRQRPLTSAG